MVTYESIKNHFTRELVKNFFGHFIILWQRGKFQQLTINGLQFLSGVSFFCFPSVGMHLMCIPQQLNVLSKERFVKVFVIELRVSRYDKMNSMGKLTLVFFRGSRIFDVIAPLAINQRTGSILMLQQYMIANFMQ